MMTPHNHSAATAVPQFAVTDAFLEGLALRASPTSAACSPPMPASAPCCPGKLQFPQQSGHVGLPRCAWR
jgi:hypothetical protein